MQKKIVYNFLFVFAIMVGIATSPVSYAQEQAEERAEAQAEEQTDDQVTVCDDTEVVETSEALEPHFSTTKTNLAKGCMMILPILDASGQPITCKSSDSSVIEVTAYDESEVEVEALKTGVATITATVDGVDISCTFAVTDPKLKKTYGFYQKNKSLKLSLTGLNAVSDPVYSSSDEKIATVTSAGKVSVKKIGSATISVVVDGKTLYYYLAVSTKTAVKAMRWGYNKVGKRQYSQARRMSKYYFDCSSFVYRCYRAAGKYLVCRARWAPVAATIGKYYVQKGRQIKTSKSTYDLSKLRPGDLICFGGSKAPRNGRYRRIYHIAIYIGNGKTMESSSTYNNVVIRDRGVIKKKYVPVIVRP